MTNYNSRCYNETWYNTDGFEEVLDCLDDTLEQPAGMRHVVLVGKFAGFNNSPSGGYFLIVRDRPLGDDNIWPGLTIHNNSTGVSGIILRIVDETVYTTVWINPGEFYTICLSKPWTLANSDGPVIEIDCRLCGWSYPREQLVNGLCWTCQDDEKPC